MPGNEAAPGQDGPDDRRPSLCEEPRCPVCEYDLRGISGDPVRCPECGARASRRALRIPAREFTRRCRRAESWATFCVGAMWLFVLGTVLWRFAGGQYGAVPCMFLALLWCFGGIAFALACYRRRGCLNVLFWFHLTGAIWAVVAVAAAWATVLVYEQVSARVWAVIYSVLLASLAVLSWLRPTWAAFLFRGPYLVGKQKLALLQRRQLAAEADTAST
jgi:hypothetical protein